MKKIINLEIVVYNNDDSFDFENLEPVAVLNNWDDFNTWMEDKIAESYIHITNGDIVEEKKYHTFKELDYSL